MDEKTESLSVQESPASAELAPLPEKTQPLEERIALLEQQLNHQNDLLERQTVLLEKQERRALYAKILLGVKILVIVILIAWLGPKVYAAWVQYQEFLTQIDSFMGQIDSFITETQNFTGNVEGFIADARTQVDALSEALSAMQDTFAPLASFLGKFGM